MDEAMDMRFDMVAQGKALGELLPDMCRQVYDIAEKWKNMEAYDFVGTGFDYAAAWFGHAKVFEALGKYAMHINSEEWLHMNFFMRNVDKIGTIIVANTTNPAMSRNKELIKFAHNLTRPLMVITDGGKEDFGVDTNYVKVPKTKYAINMPLTQFAHPRKRNDRAIEYECTRRENKGEHYVKKDKYFYKKMIFLRSRLM